jgi:hypothetical protein
MKKEITIKDFSEELVKRIDERKTIDCCVEEIKNLAQMAKKHMGDEMIEVNWKD